MELLEAWMAMIALHGYTHIQRSGYRCTATTEIIKDTHWKDCDIYTICLLMALRFQMMYIFVINILYSMSNRGTII
jgi:hypothetical protein